MTEITYRDLVGMAEFRAAEDLQRVVWGEGDLPDPADLMMVIQAEGGLVGGAFGDGRLLGYVFGFPRLTLGCSTPTGWPCCRRRGGCNWACG